MAVPAKTVINAVLKKKNPPSNQTHHGTVCVALNPWSDGLRTTHVSGRVNVNDNGQRTLQEGHGKVIGSLGQNLAGKRHWRCRQSIAYRALCASSSSSSAFAAPHKKRTTELGRNLLAAQTRTTHGCVSHHPQYNRTQSKASVLVAAIVVENLDVVRLGRGIHLGGMSGPPLESKNARRQTCSQWPSSGTCS